MLLSQETDHFTFKDTYCEFVGKAIHSVHVTTRAIENQAEEFLMDTVENMEPGIVL